MADGWIKLHRKLLDKPIWKLSTPEQKTILVTLLLMVWHRPNEWEWNGQRYMCEPGQCITSLDSIAKACGKGVSIKNVRTALERFEKYGFLANESAKQGRLITIVNWGDYQEESDKGGKATGSQPANDWQTNGKQVATNKNVKNDKNERMKEDINKDISSESNKFAPPGSGILLPLVDKSNYDVPIDKITMWEQAYPGVDVKQELYKMRAWLESNPTKQKTARGINRFINLWLDREQNSGKAKGVKADAGAGRQRIKSANEIARELAAENNLD